MGLLRLSDALRELDGFFEGAVGGGDGKFLTTQSAGESQPFGSGEEGVSELFEDRIAGEVAEVVVDRFEVGRDRAS